MLRKSAAGIVPVALISAAFATFFAGLKTVVVILTATGYFIAGTSLYDPAPKKPPTVEQAQQMLHGYTTQPITGSAVDDYPATIWPVSGLTAPTMEQSMNIGSANLDRYLRSAHDPTVVDGTSLGAVTATKWLQEHANGKDPSAPAADQVEFVLVANESRPNGGILMRFNGLYIPILGIPFIGATPQTQYKTTDVAKQWDGFADFPEDSANVLAVLNALMGIAILHPDYSNVDPTSPDNNVQVVGNTTYITVPTKHLPLLEPFRALARMLGVTKTPLLDAIEPALKVLVETGYDRSNYGAATPAKPFSSIPRLIAAMPQLVDAVRQGVESLVHPTSPVQQQVPLSSVQPDTPSLQQASVSSMPSGTPSLSQTVTNVVDVVGSLLKGFKRSPSGDPASVVKPVPPVKPIVDQPKQESPEVTNDEVKVDPSPAPVAAKADPQPSLSVSSAAETSQPQPDQQSSQAPVVKKPKPQPAFKLPTPKLPKLPTIKLPKPIQAKPDKKGSGGDSAGKPAASASKPRLASPKPATASKPGAK